jgi:hypothetical protein
MADNERQLRFEAQTREQFEALGRFVQGFEHVVYAIRTGLENRLQQEGANMVYFTRMLFHHRALTAWPLWEMLRSVIYTDASELRAVVPSDADEFHRALTKIGKEVEALIDARNNILHGTPFIGWASAEQEDFTEMEIMKWGVSAKGWKQTATPKSAADLMALVARCERAANAIRRITVASAMRDDRSKWVAMAVEELANVNGGRIPGQWGGVKAGH